MTERIKCTHQRNANDAEILSLAKTIKASRSQYIAILGEPLPYGNTKTPACAHYSTESSLVHIVMKADAFSPYSIYHTTPFIQQKIIAEMIDDTAISTPHQIAHRITSDLIVELSEWSVIAAHALLQPDPARQFAAVCKWEGMVWKTVWRVGKVYRDWWKSVTGVIKAQDDFQFDADDGAGRLLENAVKTGIIVYDLDDDVVWEYPEIGLAGIQRGILRIIRSKH